MVYRKQKKWLEFFIRMLPVIIFIFGLVINIFNFNQSATLSINIFTIIKESISNVDIFFNFFNDSNGLVFSDVFDSLISWISEYIDISFAGGRFIFSFLYYQLLMSILFLLFDFLNFIVDWARQFIGGFYAKEK